VSIPRDQKVLFVCTTEPKGKIVFLSSTGWHQKPESNKKNDNCFVEQKNFSIVRRFAGYSRYDTVEELRLLNEMYANVRLFLNFFTPTMKLISKHRDGAKVVKKYDKPITPYQRVLASPLVSNEDKRQLSAQFASVNLLSVRKNILSIQKSLLKFNSKKNKNDWSLE